MPAENKRLAPPKTATALPANEKIPANDKRRFSMIASLASPFGRFSNHPRTLSTICPSRKQSSFYNLARVYIRDAVQ